MVWKNDRNVGDADSLFEASRFLISLKTDRNVNTTAVLHELRGSLSGDELPTMTVKLEIAYIPIILPNHDHVWPNHVHLTSSLHHQIDQTYPLLVDKKIIARIMFAGDREGLGTMLLVCTGDTLNCDTGVTSYRCFENDLMHHFPATKRNVNKEMRGSVGILHMRNA